LKRLLGEPLLHFLVLGAVLFAGYAWVNRERERDPSEIAVSSGQIEHLLITFARTWQRQPTEGELKGLIDQYVREEVLSREAIKLGLDRNDTVIRRRLQQKMEFIADDLATVAAPGDAELSDWYAQNPDPFRDEPRFTFRQVYFDPERHGDRIEGEVDRLREELAAQGSLADTSTSGDPSLLPPALVDENRRAVAGSFGEEFAEAIAELPVGQWSGPVHSAFGSHLVLVEERTEARTPPLADVRDEVLREWERARREEANRQFFDRLLENYRVTIEWPRPTDALAMRE
jgi:hypothetical protein